MDRPYDFLAFARSPTLTLALSGPGVATALSAELFPMRRDDAVGGGEQSVPPRAVPRWAADGGHRSVWPLPCVVRALGW